MGLDSFLFAEKYVSNYNHASVQDKELYNKVTEAVGLTLAEHPLPRSNSATIRVEVAYWRKANQIHKFFVDLTGEEDNCQDIEVSREDLETLLSKCKQILDARDRDLSEIDTLVKTPETTTVDPSQILPTQGGFFFGSTDYDEYYYSDLEHTVQVLEKILNHPGIPKNDYSWSFIYRASW